MNKYENAIDRVARCCSDYRFVAIPPRIELTNELDILMELVEKATPKKAIQLCDNRRHKCPNCNCQLPFKKNAIKKQNPRIYCDRCGQALDRSEEDVD